MTKRIFCIFVAIVSFHIANAQLIIQNGNFELKDTTKTSFKNWNGGDEGYSITREKNSINNGVYVLKMQKTGKGEHAAFSQTINYKTSGHLEKYIFSAYIKTKNVNSGMARLWFQSFDESGNKLTAFDYKKSELHGNTEWKKVSTEAFVPSMTTKIILGGLMVGDGAAWFDNFELEKIETGKLQQSEVAKKYLDEALEIITTNSIRRDSVDFKKLRAIAYSIAEDAKTTADCYVAIKCVLHNLGDHHSLLVTEEEEKSYKTYDESKVDMPVAKLIDNKIGYITVPPFASVSEKMEKQFGDSMQHLIKAMDGQNIIGWIVDVRNNTGGNCGPMLAGIGPIMGEGVANYYVDANGKKDSMGYNNGNVFQNDTIVQKIDSPYTLIHPNPYVAVLTNGLCGSSGETVVLSFKNRPKTKSFGAPTYGLSTGNSDFKLSDGAVILLTSGIGCDRLGNVYGGKIQPDVFVDDNEKTKNDEVVDTAVKWLEGNK